jgi:hypothetical protein
MRHWHISQADDSKEKEKKDEAAHFVEKAKVSYQSHVIPSPTNYDQATDTHVGGPGGIVDDRPVRLSPRLGLSIERMGEPSPSQPNTLL